MRDEILSYWEMCARERKGLQRGMYFGPSPSHSIVLMSRRKDAIYEDQLSDDGLSLTYEGHDVLRSSGFDPKEVDQSWVNSNGKPTENARFAGAAREVEQGNEQPSKVRVYEKLRDGVWSDRGLFELLSFQYKRVGKRKVFRFQMRLTSEESTGATPASLEQLRVIPSWVKQEVFKRDKGRCVLCGAVDQLHFDHELPFSKGGSSITPKNVRILCARHNLKKGPKIE